MKKKMAKFEQQMYTAERTMTAMRRDNSNTTKTLSSISKTLNEIKEPVKQMWKAHQSPAPPARRSPTPPAVDVHQVDAVPGGDHVDEPLEVDFSAIAASSLDQDWADLAEGVEVREDDETWNASTPPEVANRRVMWQSSSSSSSHGRSQKRPGRRD